MRKAKILIIEDEHIAADAARRHLEAQGYAVRCTETLAQAREEISRNPPDVMLLDVQLPDGNGYDFCDEIRNLTSAPIIYLTCMDKNENIVHGLSLGGDDYITKPYSLDVLSARIAAQLRRAGLQGAGRIELPPLSINLQNGSIKMAGETIELSPKELQLLAFFAGHIGRRFTASELYAEVWGEGPEIETRTVRMHISSLRKKLGFGENAAFDIQTTKNEGYVFTRQLDEPEW